jgi:linoleate 10R-lipoxygenase
MGRGQYICQKLLDINERAKFSWPPPEDEKARRKQDDELFERARLINWSGL